MTPFAPDIFTEALMSQLLPVTGEVVLYAMKAFGGYDLNEALYFAVLGATIASAVWYGLGRLLRNILTKKKADIPGDRAIQKNKFTRCSICGLGLLAGFSTLGFIMIPLAGLWRANPWVIIPLIAVSHAVGYQILVLN